MMATAKEFNDFGGFDRDVKKKRWRFWPSADGPTWEGSQDVVEAEGADAFEARALASLLLAQKGRLVAPQDLSSVLVLDVEAP
jgi:hypothetical protein